MEGLEIRTAVRTDARHTAEVLARAFHDDPAFRWILPVDRSRDRRLRRYFRTELRHEVLRYGAVDLALAGGRVAGAALWVPPGAWTPGTQASALPGYLRAFGRRVGVASRYMSAAVREHPRGRPHWYLAVIGVDPAWQGRGVGAALLRSRLERCDAQGSAAYLESSNPRNVPLYEHFGFQVTGTVDLPPGAPVLHRMWRPAPDADDEAARGGEAAP